MKQRIVSAGFPQERAPARSRRSFRGFRTTAPVSPPPHAGPVQPPPPQPIAGAGLRAQGGLLRARVFVRRTAYYVLVVMSAVCSCSWLSTAGFPQERTPARSRRSFRGFRTKALVSPPPHAVPAHAEDRHNYLRQYMNHFLDPATVLCAPPHRPRSLDTCDRSSAPPPRRPHSPDTCYRSSAPLPGWAPFAPSPS